jgi:tetratricopeptide (TPR) repeat protein
MGMKRMMMGMAVAAVFGASMLVAQKAPQPKSQKEVEALMAIQNAADPDARIAAIENLLTKFADTDYKPMVLEIATSTMQQKGDFEKMMVYAERALEANPGNVSVILMMASGIAQRTREFDLDKDEKLARVDKLTKDAESKIATLVKPNPAITDEQWEGAKKDFQAQVHEARGMAATVRKKYDVAIPEFTKAIEVAAQPDPATYIRLAAAQNNAGKPDDALATVAKVMALPNLNPVVKQFADQEKARAEKLKAQPK